MTSFALDQPLAVPPFALKRSSGLSGFTDSALAAMDGSPGYFAVWYTVKSLALVGAVAWIAYKLGKEAGRAERSAA